MSVAPRTDGTLQLSLRTERSRVPLKRQQLKLSGALDLDNEQLTDTFIPSVFVCSAHFPLFFNS